MCICMKEGLCVCVCVCVCVKKRDSKWLYVYVCVYASVKETKIERVCA